MPAFLTELFATSSRSSGLSFGYQISSAVAGGLSPVAATALAGGTGSWVPVAVMISVAMVVSLVAVLASRSSLRSDLLD
jgi:MHS family shikimate/dehydroshikimate transporter-like MFS transporter